MTAPGTHSCLGHILDAEKKFLLAPQPKKSASNFCDLFHFTLSLIFTRTVAIWPFAKLSLQLPLAE